MNKTSFWDRVDKSGGVNACWPWTRGRHPKGYGAVKYKGRDTYAHRVAFALANGKIPTGLCVCHRCDNPPCCNPAHLFAGTHGDNNRDTWAKGRGVSNWPRRVGNDLPWAKLTPRRVRWIRKHCVPGSRGPRSMSEVARKFGVTKNAVMKVLRGENWTHIK